MRAVAFALSLLVLGSFGAAAQQASPQQPSPQQPSPQQQSPLTSDLNLNPRDIAAMGIGALLGFFAAEPLGVSQFVGAVTGTIVGAWWYADHGEMARPAAMKPVAARQVAARYGEIPTLVPVR